jgi:preprotein translocase subunit YajC
MTIPFLITLADAAPASPGGGIGNSIFIPMMCVMAILYFMMIRPQNQRQKELTKRIAALKTGDKVVTNGGIHGIISNVKEGTTLMLKIADNVKIEIDKSSIATVVPREESVSTPATT